MLSVNTHFQPRYLPRLSGPAASIAAAPMWPGTSISGGVHQEERKADQQDAQRDRGRREPRQAAAAPISQVRNRC
jgi:hypothetical protein